MMNITETVKQLIIINVIFFLGTMFVPAAFNYLALWYFENPNFQFWQPLTHMFMHGGWMHIFFNMFALYSFGSTLEHFWGGKKFLFFYISCGLGAALLHSGVNYYLYHDGLNSLIENGVSQSEVVQLLSEGKINPNWSAVLGGMDKVTEFGSAFAAPAVGASGAIYGLLVAFAFMFPNAELALMFIPVPIKAKYFVPGLLLVDLYLGMSGRSIFGGPSGIAHFAHIGGAIVGFLMMWFWKKNQFNNNRWDR
ncbi:rhomboid family intramembrane serine protease [Flavobacterium supellecticarium]|uniref:Rhomboid family intramembrane serine protease n=1 Tax=Flavobacterium supellecticarium TaxID=2565924 RepID=A0A4S3ZW22_9FLAO|nr:rhomboid family intramembrane serine protease [Flavobacterium supellecticarium]THF49967.1 rhomboid family intramembrane serine protease [Flavobacterium supellecticarium]